MSELIIGGISAESLAKTYGTPLYVYDEAKIDNRICEYTENFKSELFETKVLYASKAFQCIELLHKIEDAGLYLDVVSGGEIFTALEADFPADKIYFHGNNKTPEEIEFAVSEGITHFVCDNLMELKGLEQEALKQEKSISVMLRLNLGIEAHTHEYIITSYVDSKFGMALESEEYLESIATIESSRWLELEGFHSHIGSQIFEMDAWFAAIDKLVDLVAGFPQRLSLNIGGGFGIRYTKEDKPLSIPEVVAQLVHVTEAALAKRAIQINALMIEPGRSLIGEAGTTLYTIGYQKKTPNKHYVFVDGGMTDNIRPALYQAKYSCDAVTQLGKEKTNKVTIAGKMCESGDVVIEDTYLPEVAQGDILAVYSTGAYGYSMSSNYNRATTPAVIFVKDGVAKEVIKRQTFKDLLRNDVRR
ncbi:diaminopimelate decarboxylase [Vagococcus elongatus]|uniref:Diaminopimelate decarboxylase n=1 Tax=Vagococcus elongatus TaxID=180344 RepID=A0A430AQQ8_9ENTE|nr:diaminopimelate decarboxylase [Vagococcus elongatus]RSU10313.1 diaminopimelate decarboxylase [Vagococcus elongatus]